jgi:hypothetical protein
MASRRTSSRFARRAAHHMARRQAVTWQGGSTGRPPVPGQPQKPAKPQKPLKP